MVNTIRGASDRMTRVQWLICVIAAIGFAFDTYELLMLPLIVRPAVLDLTGAAPGTPEFTRWTGLAVLCARGVRRRLRSARRLPHRPARPPPRARPGASCSTPSRRSPPASSTSIEWLLFFRSTTFIGVCVEFVAAVAWLAELFPDPKRREAVLGYTQAFGSVGGLMVTARLRLRRRQRRLAARRCTAGTRRGATR